MRSIPVFAFFTVLAITSGTTLADEWKDESGKGKEGKGRYSEQRGGKHGGEREQDRGGGSYFHEHGYTHLSIPEGHYPPPGECRIWYPDRPPGHQPPPVKCGAPVPAGAWLIRHPADVADRVHVTVYEPNRPGAVLAIGEFDIAQQKGTDHGFLVLFIGADSVYRWITVVCPQSIVLHG